MAPGPGGSSVSGPPLPPEDSDRAVVERRGAIRSLTRAERADLYDDTLQCYRAFCGCCCCCGAFRYVVTEPYSLTWNGRRVTVPIGFVTDGWSGFYDDFGGGVSWVYHDYLYAAHEFTSGEACSRQEADQVMADVLRENNNFVVSCLIRLIVWLNPFYSFSSSWNKAGRKGPILLNEELGRQREGGRKR